MLWNSIVMRYFKIYLSLMGWLGVFSLIIYWVQETVDTWDSGIPPTHKEEALCAQ